MKGWISRILWLWWLLALLTFIIWSFITAGPTNKKTAPKSPIRIPATINPIATLDLLICMTDVQWQKKIYVFSCPCVSWNVNVCAVVCYRPDMNSGWQEAAVRHAGCVYTLQTQPRLTLGGVITLNSNPCQSMWSHITVRWQLDPSI